MTSYFPSLFPGAADYWQRVSFTETSGMFIVKYLVIMRAFYKERGSEGPPSGQSRDMVVK